MIILGFKRENTPYLSYFGVQQSGVTLEFCLTHEASDSLTATEKCLGDEE